MFTPVAELAVTHVPDGKSDMKVTLDQVRQTLAGAGVNPALVSFGGSMVCLVHRDIGAVQEELSLDQWIDSHRAVASASEQTLVQPVQMEAAPAAPTDKSSLRQLRTMLAADLCGRLHLDPDNLELTFNSVDDKVLNLAEPYFQFQIIPKRVRTLGDVEWEVVIASGSQRQKATIDAVARVWITESVVKRPVAYQQTINDQDVDEKRILIDALSSEVFLPKSEVVGQSAARDLRLGTVLTPDMVDPKLLVHPGQLITINIARGNIRMTAVAKSLQVGSMGQTIRARSDTDPTRIFEVTLTGPQEGTVSSEPDDNSPVAAAAH
jgi:flagella basal body P-ring formation protein FlgA